MPNKIYPLTLSLVILLCWAIANYLGSTGLIILSAFLVLPADEQSLLRQSLLRGLLVLTALCAALIVLYFTKNDIYLFYTTIGLSLFVLGSCIYDANALSPLTKQSFIIFFAIFFLLCLRHQPINLMMSMSEILIGCTLGTILPQLIFSKQPYAAFRSDVKAFITNMIIHTDYLLHQPNIVMALKENKSEMNVQAALITHQYPNWIYETGFNPGLRASFRFYLIHLEQLSDLWIVFHDAALRAEWNDDILAKLKIALANNSNFLKNLENYFSSGSLPTANYQNQDDINELDEAVDQSFPLQSEFMEMQTATAALYQAVHAIKDARFILLKLCLGIS